MGEIPTAAGPLFQDASRMQNAGKFADAAVKWREFLRDYPGDAAVGLVYVNTRGGPVMGFHMWTEVWVRGQWLAIDATLGEGSIGAAHIKVADHSWHDIQSLTPLLPVLRVLGKLTIEVVEAS